MTSTERARQDFRRRQQTPWVVEAITRGGHRATYRFRTEGDAWRCAGRIEAEGGWAEYRDTRA